VRATTTAVPRGPAAGSARPRLPLEGPARRRALLDALDPVGAVPGDVLAERFGVSRQAIVHDIAILRAAGSPIVATIRGYIFAPSTVGHRNRIVVAVRHRPEDAVDELTALVDLGVRIVDVVVEHPVYGELRVELQLASRADVDAWAQATRESGAHLLSELSGGVHLHTLEAEVPERLERAKAALGRLGFLVDDRRTD
jgi:transcriptional regulator of NAD metabolism